MAEMPKCTFCKRQYEFPKGITVVQKDGKAKYFCSKKCRSSFEMGRDNRKVSWVRKVKKTDKLAEKKEKKE